MEGDHYVTREEYERLLSMAQPKAGFFTRAINFVLWFTVGLAAVGGITFLLFLGSDFLGGSAPAGAAPTTTSRGVTTTKPSSGGPSGGASTTSSDGGPSSALPDCGSVSDTTTACQGTAPAPTPIFCEDVLPGAGLMPCQWRDAAAAKALQEQTEREALALWEEMADQAIEADLRGPGPTAEVPTECQNPQSARARASCELIKRGLIHPKG